MFLIQQKGLATKEESAFKFRIRGSLLPPYGPKAAKKAAKEQSND